MNVRRMLLWKLSTLALAFLLITVLALVGSDTSYETPGAETEGAAWTQEQSL